MRSPMRSEDRIYILESGGDGGQFSAVIPSWPGSVQVLSKQIKEA